MSYNLLPAWENCGDWNSSVLFGDRGDTFPSLSDVSLYAIPELCPKLQNLNNNYNRRVTFDGVRRAASASPLRELLAYKGGSSDWNLDELVSLFPTLFLVRFGSGLPFRQPRPN